MVKYDARIGSFTWWDLNNTKITPADLRTILQYEGVTIDVPDIDPVSAIRRAAGSWSQGRGNSDRFKAEVTSVEGNSVYVGILRHEREGSRKVAWKQIELLHFDTQLGAWTNQHVTEEGQQFVKLADQFRTFLDHRWIRPNIIQSALTAMHAVSLRSQGGIYFVPVQFNEELQRLKRIVRNLGDSALHVAGIEGDEDSREAVSASTRDSVLASVGEIEEQLQAWQESSRKIRTDSQATLLGQLGGLVEQAELYEAALDVKLGDLRSKIESARRRAMQILAEKG